MPGLRNLHGQAGNFCKQFASNLHIIYIYGMSSRETENRLVTFFDKLMILTAQSSLKDSIKHQTMHSIGFLTYFALASPAQRFDVSAARKHWHIVVKNLKATGVFRQFRSNHELRPAIAELLEGRIEKRARQHLIVYY